MYHISFYMCGRRGRQRTDSVASVAFDWKLENNLWCSCCFYCCYRLDYMSIYIRGLATCHNIMCKYTDNIEWAQETDRLNDVCITDQCLMSALHSVWCHNSHLISMTDRYEVRKCRTRTPRERETSWHIHNTILYFKYYSSIIVMFISFFLYVFYANTIRLCCYIRRTPLRLKSYNCLYKHDNNNIAQCSSH